jgi:hypothetical protein
MGTKLERVEERKALRAAVDAGAPSGRRRPPAVVERAELGIDPPAFEAPAFDPPEFDPPAGSPTRARRVALLAVQFRIGIVAVGVGGVLFLLTR